MSKRIAAGEKGFSLLELVMALAIFLIVCGVAFEMLLGAMKRYHDDSQLLNSFQEARFGLDQMVRDVNDSGYPPRNQYEASTTPAVNLYASTPFAWSAGNGYPNTPCTMGTSCGPPGDYDLIVETDIDPQNNNGVEWVRYQLNGTTLSRGVVSKSNSDPDAATSGTVLVPYIENVMNNPPPAQLAALQAVYPGMYPGGQPVPIFKYICDAVPQPRECTDPLVSIKDPEHIVGVVITLIVQAPTTELQSGVPRLVQLRGEGRRINPD